MQASKESRTETFIKSQLDNDIPHLDHWTPLRSHFSPQCRWWHRRIHSRFLRPTKNKTTVSVCSYTIFRTHTFFFDHCTGEALCGALLYPFFAKDVLCCKILPFDTVCTRLTRRDLHPRYQGSSDASIHCTCKCAWCTSDHPVPQISAYHIDIDGVWPNRGRLQPLSSVPCSGT